MPDALDDLLSALRRTALEPTCTSTWAMLEAPLCDWREPHEGGVVPSDYIDDHLDRILDEKLVHTIFHLTQLQPEAHSRRCILLARHLWDRLVVAIESAAIVAQIRSARRGGSSPCSDATSPTFRVGALSPPPKCK